MKSLRLLTLCGVSALLFSTAQAYDSGSYLGVGITRVKEAGQKSFYSPEFSLLYKDSDLVNARLSLESQAIRTSYLFSIFDGIFLTGGTLGVKWNSAAKLEGYKNRGSSSNSEFIRSTIFDEGRKFIPTLGFEFTTHLYNIAIATQLEIPRAFRLSVAITFRADKPSKPTAESKLPQRSQEPTAPKAPSRTF